MELESISGELKQTSNNKRTCWNSLKTESKKFLLGSLPEYWELFISMIEKNRCKVRITVFCFCHLSNVWFSNYSLASEWDWSKPVVYTVSIFSSGIFLAVKCWLIAAWLWRITATRNLSFPDWPAARLSRQRQGWVPAEPKVQAAGWLFSFVSFPLATPRCPRRSWPCRCLSRGRSPQVLHRVWQIRSWLGQLLLMGQWIMRLG